MSHEYDTNYPKKRIGKGNPYYQCAGCEVSDPEINGELTNHRPWCPYRKQKELENRLLKEIPIK